MKGTQSSRKSKHLILLFSCLLAYLMRFKNVLNVLQLN